MESAIFISKLLGVFLLLMGVSFLVNMTHMKKMILEMTKSSPLTFLGGIMLTVFGLLLVLFHPTWSWSWRVVITAFGWLTLLRGALRLLAPTFSASVLEKAAKSKHAVHYMAWFALILGVFFTYYGFFVQHSSGGWFFF